MRKKVLVTPLLALVLLVTCLSGCGNAAPVQSDAPSSPPPFQTAQVTPSPSPSPTPVETPEPEPPSPSVVPKTSVPSVAPQTTAQTTYILNTNTKKFHKPTCSSVDQMKESNKQAFTGTRDEAIARGYSPCGRCHP